MYRISVPVHLNNRTDRKKTVSELRRCGATRVFVGIGPISLDEKKFGDMIDRIREQVAFYKSNGFEVGIWGWTLWRTDIDVSEKDELIKVSASGKQNIIGDDMYKLGETSLQGFCCPISEKFLNYFSKQMEAIASCGADIIMFDDDFGYGSIGCFCEKHKKLIAERFGKEYSREELLEKIYSEKTNDFRVKWHRIMGEGLEEFAIKTREVVDRVDPNIRIGLCSVMSLWDNDGTDVMTVAKLLAGKNKPLVRLIGAPYWANERSWGNRLQHVIELERMESFWCEGEDVEIMTEGDVFPRPRHRTPSALLEGFDTALRTCGIGDGILKYMLDYTSSATYEHGYIDKHLKNADVYESINRIFGDKKCVGVHVFETQKKFDTIDFNGMDAPRNFANEQFYSRAARMLSDNTIPTVYGEESAVGIAFGENARHVKNEEIRNGMILDARAAKILSERDVDVGIESFGERYSPAYLYYPDQDEYTQSLYGENSVCKMTPKAGAKVVTYSLSSEYSNDMLPDSIFYENAKGERFLVFGFDSIFTDEKRWRSYSMQKLLYSAIEWIGRRPLPIKCEGNPDLYTICKENKNRLAVGLWNFFIDRIDEPKIVLGEEYKSAEFINCSGTLKGNVIELSPIEPYAFAFINLKK